MTEEVFAAGTVCWTRETRSDGSERVLVLVIHRPKRRDVSFPKGKLDPGESLPQAAVRETREETGLKVRLDQHLGTIRYDLSGNRRKTVQYWAAHVPQRTVRELAFQANAEVDAIAWVPVDEVRDQLTYAADRELFDVFLKLAARDLIDSFSVTLLRHGKALPRAQSDEPDHLRPLTDFGRAQAAALVPILDAFGPRRLHTSTATRCVDTIAPYAHRRRKAVRQTDAISQDAWDAGELDGLRALVSAVVARGKDALLCSHRPVLPDLARELALATGSELGAYLEEAATLPTAGFSVFHLSRRHPGAGILSVETYPLKH
ncbi:NUDIX hydrolase [Leucobacter chromiiresistens]|uniref:NUDIX hydrolase n=1 Tax=Leucobacter chromiiresistens TaxID=1079994 RepID=A0A147EPT7_9MICO|nr:NUDIX domain-containing protein [Leucobacter chromiiresistens]KTR86410.1 NUDIX hydrolase [Leucobacter chromiiresistens]